jgi:hypothetical protein
MDNKHCIESAVLQISYSSEELALSQHSQLESFAKSEMLAIVDEAFNELSGPDEVLGIDRLEIDLGEISAAYFYEDFGALLKEKIKEIIDGQIQQQEISGGKSYRKISTQHSELDLICQFLQTGRLPWNANSHQSDIENLLQRVIDDNGLDLIEFVRAAKNRNDLITRLTTQFSAKPLCALLTLLVEPSAMELASHLEKMLALGSEHFSLNPTDIGKRVWADLFQTALLSRTRKLSGKEVIGRIIQVFSLHVSHRYSAFIERLARITTGDRRNWELSKLIQEVVLESNGLDKTESSVVNDFDGLTEPDAVQDKRDQELRARVLTYKARLIEAINTGGIARLEPIWDSLRKQAPQMLDETLRTLGQSVAVRRNIARGFSDSMIRDSVEVLEPTNYQFIEQVVSEPYLHVHSEVGARMPASDAKKSLWEFTLTYLLVDRGSRFNKRSYIGYVMLQLAANLNMDVSDLYQSILSLLQPINNTGAVYGEIVELLLELENELPSRKRNDQLKAQDKSVLKLEPGIPDTNSQTAIEQAQGQIAPPETIEQAVRLAFSGTDLSELKAVWKLVLTQYSQWFTRIIRDAGRTASVRENIARTFSNPMFEIVIDLIEPANAKYLTEVVHRSTTKPPVDGVRHSVAQKTKRLVREFTLTYLLVDRGSSFNKKTYLAGLVKKLAAHDNMSTQSVLQALVESIESVAYKSDFQRQMLAMIQEVSKELRVDAKPEHAVRPPEIGLASVKPASIESVNDRTSTDGSAKEFEEFELIRAYLLYEKLVSEIGSASGSISYHVVRLIHELIEHYPWIFHRFNQEVNSGQLVLLPIIVQLPKSLQRKLIVSFFSSMASNYRFSQSEFEKKLDAFVAANPASKTGYGAILARLIGNRLKEIESIFDQAEIASYAAENFSKDSGRALNGDDVRQARQDAERVAAQFDKDNSTPLSLNKSTSNLIKAYLLGQLTFSDQDRNSIVSTLELLLSSHPGALAQLLKESLTDTQAANRLVDILPESLLVKLLLLLRPQDHTKSILYADLMTMAAVQAEKSTRGVSGLLHLTKWQFIFNYMVIEGRRFNEVSFVKLFAEYLQARSAVSPKSDFMGQLSNHVSKTSSGGTYVAAVRIAMILGNAATSEQKNHSARLQQLAQPSGVGDSATGQSNEADPEQALGIDESYEPEFESTGFDEDDDSIALESVYIDNAGLVLLAPYIPRYFDMLGLLEKNKFKNREAAERGVHLLQYLLNESTDSFEYQLVLNKLLCGVDAGVPITRSIEITDEEKAASESLLKGVIANWPILKNTSIAGFRESFLQREAHLQLKNESWQLLVQSKAFDMLLDSLPWSYATIKLSWMKRPIQVDWR